MSSQAVERLARLALRHGEEAMLECVRAACELSDEQGTERVQQLAAAVAHGGQIPESPPAPMDCAGRPALPDAGLIAVWASVESLRARRGMNISAACRALSQEKGTRRHPIPGGVSLHTDDGGHRWQNHGTLRRLHQTAQKRRQHDQEFAMVADMVLSDLSRKLSENPAE